MTHPIDPLPKLSDEQVGEWLIDDGYQWDSSELTVITITTNRLKNVAHKAAQWGADQELEACLRLVEIDGGEDAYDFARYIRAARRPKPASLKEQALSSLTQLVVDLDRANMRDQATILEGPIRRALEQLDD